MLHVAKTDAGDNRKKVCKDDFVINSRSDRKGSAGVSQMDGSVSLISTVLEPCFYLPKFAHHLFRSYSFQEEFYRYGKGIVADLWSTRYAEMKNIVVPLMSLDEQEAIANFLDREIARIDKLIAEKQNFIKLLKEKRQALISHVVTKGLDPNVKMKDSGIEWIGEVPVHWTTTRVKFLVREPVQMGPFGASLKELAFEPTGYKLYGQENYISNDFNRGKRWLWEDTYKSLNKYELKPGDVVFTRKGSIGNCRKTPTGIEIGIIDSDSIRVRLNNEFIATDFFVTLAHESWYVSHQLDFGKRGAVLSGLNTANISNLIIVLAPVAEQQEILAHLRSRTVVYDNLINEVTYSINLLKEHRSSIFAN
ncbi:restriction endonuclease subunit S domain-containing protein [Methylotuvimicrobium alcaliphilum]|nr:restriction endonuclease subunit S [Methylotuvimicrobium alcaliphilum]